MEDGCNNGKFVQRFACRNRAQTTRRQMVNSLRYFAQPARRTGSRIAAESPCHHQHQAAWEMGRHSSTAWANPLRPQNVSLQIFAAVKDRRYSKTNAIRTACLCYCHTLFDAEIAHRRHRWPVDLPHRTRFGRRSNVRSGCGANKALRRHDCDGN